MAIKRMKSGLPESLHPVQSAVQFLMAHNASGGASMNVRSGNVLPPKTRGFVVGGEPDRHGNRIPEQVHTGSLTVGDVMAYHRQLKAKSDHPQTMLGSWHDPESGRTAIDASRVHGSKSKAIATAKERGEDAIWDNKNMKEIRTK